MQRLWDEIDLTVVAMVLISAPAVWLSWFGLAVPLLLPQGRIGIRAIVDYPAFKRTPWVYLAVNEFLVFAFVGVLAKLRFAFTAGA